ncbi:MAG: DUF308 domain-containing protein [Spirochaetales bacterium]|nr:DUF308 domain-containing protein [Spirochaetales bacterium]
MGTIKDWVQKVFIGVCAVILGAFIFFQTENFAMFLVIAIGVFAVINGFFVLYTGVKAGFSHKTKTTLVIRGTLGLVAGIIAIFLPMMIINITWTVMLYILGIQLIASGILELYGVIEMRKMEMPTHARIAEAIVSIVLAVLIMSMPQEIGKTLLRVIGAMVLVYGIVMIVNGYRRRREDEGDIYLHGFDNK